MSFWGERRSRRSKTIVEVVLFCFLLLFFVLCFPTRFVPEKHQPLLDHVTARALPLLLAEMIVLQHPRVVCVDHVPVETPF